MVGIAEGSGYRRGKDTAYQSKDKRRDEQAGHRCGIDGGSIFALFVGKAEEACLHAIGKDDEQ